MWKNENSVLFLLLANILVCLTDAVSKDLCETCKRADECPRYGAMSRDQQQKWIQDYPCKGSESDGGSPLPGFSSIAKGDYVCCPSSKVWGITNDYTEPGSNSDVKINPNSYDIPRYLWYNQNQPGNAYNSPQPRIPNDPQNGYYGGNNRNQPQSRIPYNPQNGYYNGGNGNKQCPAQSAPPAPESGCCGVEVSQGDRITDVQRFLQKSLSPSWGTESNYPRYQRAISPDSIERSTADDIGISIDDRIAGGREAELEQYPWTVFMSISFVGKNGTENFACGGSLISSRFVLTAAHCVVNEGAQLSKITITLAEYDRRTFPKDCITLMTISGRSSTCIENIQVSATDVYIHPQFNEDHLINDIALVRLREDAPYTDYIRPICLPPINIDNPQFSDLPLSTAGWGLNVSVQSDVKQFTVVNLVPKSQCKPHYAILTEGHICAAGKRTQDTCKGDSGGPLMMMYQGKYYVAGIVSGKTSAAPCGTPIPSLYTNVYAYLDWIRNFVR